MSNKKLVCWACGASLSAIPLPLSRRDQCETCNADLHVCLLCEWYRPNVSKQCHEPIAEEVRDKEHSNFCDYFKIKPDAFNPNKDDAANAAKAELDALFGNANTSTTSPKSDEDKTREQLDNLFKK